MRYAWDQFDAYFGPEQVGDAPSRLLRPVMAAAGPVGCRHRRPRGPLSSRILIMLRGGSADTIIAGRPLCIPLSTQTSTARARPRRSPKPVFLVVSALVPYKRLDVAIEACRADRGAAEDRRARARGSAPAAPGGGAGTVEFLGWLSDDEIRDLYRRAARGAACPASRTSAWCRSKRRPAARPVVALAEAGRCESVVDGVTGVLVDDRSAEAFADAPARRVAALQLDAARRSAANAERFARARFRTDFQTVRDAADRRRRYASRRRAAADAHDAAV